MVLHSHPKCPDITVTENVNPTLNGDKTAIHKHAEYLGSHLGQTCREYNKQKACRDTVLYLEHRLALDSVLQMHVVQHATHNLCGVYTFV